jgi:hypothetical protein
MNLYETPRSVRPERSRGAHALTHSQRPSTLVYPERPPQAAAEGLGTNESRAGSDAQ